MTKTYRLQGLDCANCASKIERNVGKIKDVESVVVNFITQKLIIECSETNLEDVSTNIKNIVKKIDSAIIIKDAYSNLT